MLTNRSIIISGAWFRSPINLENSSLPVAIYIWQSRFDKKVNLLGADISGTIGFDGSAFRSKLNLDEATVDGSVFLRSGARFQSVELIRAQISGSLDSRGSTFKDKLDISTARVDGNVYLNGGSKYQSVNLIGAQISGSIDASGSTFKDELTLMDAKIERNVSLNDGGQYQRVDLVAAQISGNVEASGSTFKGELYINSAKVDGNVFLIDGSKFQYVDLIAAEVGGGVFATKSAFEGELDLYTAQVNGSILLYESQFAGDVICSGATIGGALALSRFNQNPTWNESAKIDLEGASIGAIDDAVGAWPQNVWLAGLVVQQVRGPLTGPGQGFIDRSTSWYLNWLDRDRGFSPEPYKQLEVLLRNNGTKQIADGIAMARMDHELASGGGFRRALGFLHRYTVGYGYQPERAIVWIVVLIAVGAVVARRLPEETLAEVPSRLVLSAQRLIPLIDFGKCYREADVTGKDVPAPVRGYFYLHAVLGYVLAAFVVTTLARITTT
jgi:hypothetical protein